jgi:hypothetical protein
LTSKLFQNSHILFYCIINKFPFFFLKIINDKKFSFSIIFLSILSSRFLDNSKKLCDFLWSEIDNWRLNLKVFLRWNCNKKVWGEKADQKFSGENKFHRLSAQFPIILFLFDWLNKAKINPLQWDRKENSMIRNWFSFLKDYSED